LRAPASGEDGEAGEQPLLIARQEVAAPFDRCTERALALRHVSRAAGQQRQAALEAPGDVRRRQRLHARGAIARSPGYGADDALEDFTPATFVCGTGLVDRRRVVVGGDDFTVRGGASDASIHEKQVWAERTANALRIPLVRLVEGTGGGGSVRSLEELRATYVPANPGWGSRRRQPLDRPVAAAGLGPVAGVGPHGSPRRISA